MRFWLHVGTQTIIAHGDPPAVWPMTARGPITVSRHTGHGPTHYDLFLGVGSTCPTLSVRCERGVWLACWLPAHRRRYLTWSGPVPGRRGIVAVRQHGLAYWHRHAAGWQIRISGISGCRMTRTPKNRHP